MSDIVESGAGIESKINLNDEGVIKAKVKELINSIFTHKISDVDSLDEDSGFAKLGDSLERVEAIMAIENEFDILIPDEDAEKMETLGDLVRHVQEKVKAKND